MFDLNVYPYPITERLTAPGFMVFPPAGKVARGRENNLLIVHFTLMGETAITVEGLHAWMENKAEAFHRNPGTVTASMRELIESVNMDLYQRNARPSKKTSQVIVNLQVAVLKREVLYLANCGSGQSVLIGSQNTIQSQDTENANIGLGLSQSISIRFSQSIVAANDYLLMSFSPPSTWSAETFSGGQTLAVEALSRRLFGATNTPGRGVLIRFQEGTGKINLLRYSQGQHSEQPSEKPIEPVSVALIAENSKLNNEVLPEPPAPKPAEPFIAPFVRAEPAPVVKPAAVSPVRAPVRPPVQPEPEPEPVKTPSVQTEAVKTAVGNALRGGARLKGQADDLAKDIMQKVMPGDPDKPLRFSRGFLIFIAIAIPVLIAAIGLTVFLRTAKAPSPEYLALAQKFYQQSSTDNADGATELSDLQQSLYWLDFADKYGKSTDSVALRNQVQSSVDSLEGTIRVDMTPSLSDVLLPGTEITQMLATSTDLYALDKNTGKVLRFALSGSSYTQDSKFDCGPNPKSPLNAIGNLVDMVVISPDNSYNATILAVDANGTLDYCVPEDTGYIVKLPAPDMGWGAISSISLYQNDLYVLDIKGNAVYRFQGSGVDFADKPTLFFDEQIPPLSDALDIEVIGYELEILRGNGQMIYCTYSPIKDMKSTECQTPAQFLDTRAGQNTQVDSFPEAQFVQMHMTESPDSSIYLLDSGKDLVYHFSYARSLQRVLHPRLLDGTDSSSLIPTAFAVSPSRVLFMAYSNQIYYGQIP